MKFEILILTLVLGSFAQDQNTNWGVKCEFQSDYDQMITLKHIPECKIQQLDTFSNSDLCLNYDAIGQWNDTLLEIGTSFLWIQTCYKTPDMIQAFAAGFLEGVATQKRTWQYYRNNLQGMVEPSKAVHKSWKGELPKPTQIFIEQNDQFMRKMLMQYHYKPYWHVIGLNILQNDGLFFGYKQAAPQEEQIQQQYYRLMNIMGSLEDLQSYQVDNKTQKPSKKKNFLDSDHCSSLIKVTSDGNEIFFGHETYSTYEGMTRIWKQYDFYFHNSRFSRELIPATKISFPGYPATSNSQDDFYMTSQQLAVSETTNAIFDMDLYKKNLNPETVLESYRIMVANRLATTAKQWVEISSLLSDGTYCNQWMVLDYKLFSPGKPLPDGLFYVAEQIPGDIIFMDATWALRLDGYWASYNVPYFQATWHRAGWKQMYEQYGNYFHHDKTSRKFLFAREQKKIVDMQTFMDAMRYQDLYNDPLSSCSFINTTCVPDYSGRLMIASRQDLSPRDGKYPFSILEHSDHGALDAKLTSYEFMKEFKMRAISSPAYELMPPFDWSTIADFNVSHEGLPEKWTFPWFDFGFN